MRAHVKSIDAAKLTEELEMLDTGRLLDISVGVTAF